MYSAKTKLLQATVKEGNRDLKEKWWWLGSCVMGVGKGDESRDLGGFGGICGREGEASKTLNIYFCLCVSKVMLAVTGVFFLPGMKQK